MKHIGRGAKLLVSDGEKTVRPAAVVDTGQGRPVIVQPVIVQQWTQVAVVNKGRADA